MRKVIHGVPKMDSILQWGRFGLVGLKSNALYFVLYVLLSLAGLGPKIAVTLVFAFGIIYTFWFNKNFVFRNAGNAKRQIAGYFVVYLVAWLINLLALEVMVTEFVMNRYISQGVLVCLLAPLIFLSLKHLVFRVT